MEFENKGTSMLVRIGNKVITFAFIISLFWKMNARYRRNHHIVEKDTFNVGG